MGAQMVGEVASKTSAVAGDGTITATMLAQATVREGMKFVADGMNPMGLKRGIDKAVTAIGEIIARTMEKTGEEGAIMIEDGKSLQNELKIVEGMQFDAAGSRVIKGAIKRTLHIVFQPLN